MGKTAGRGTKGSGARQGKPLSKFHEGGQTRIYRRLPTRGFSNHDFRTEWYIVNVSDLNDFEDGATVDTNSLQEKGLVPDAKRQVKILGDGNLTRKLTVVAGWYSKSAHQKITTAGGAAQNPKGEAFVFPKPKPRFDKRKQAEAAKGKGKGKKQEAPAEGASPEAAAAAPAEEKGAE
jgi:large subunit ribosomal protein L15